MKLFTCFLTTSLATVVPGHQEPRDEPTDRMEYILYTCDGSRYSTGDCAKILKREVDSLQGEEHNCIVNRGRDNASYATYRAKYDGFDSWMGMCAPKVSREPIQSQIDIGCQSAYTTCHRDVWCMRDHIRELIDTGTLNMCRADYNLIVTADGDWNYYGSGIFEAKDGASYAECGIYCV